MSNILKASMSLSYRYFVRSLQTWPFGSTFNLAMRSESHVAFHL